jgi:formate-dependent phosphoribosylglycinamide formyltransferase (GAR transformylase)
MRIISISFAILLANCYNNCVRTYKKEVIIIKTININTSIHDLVKSYPEIKDIMNNLGFDNIVNPVMLNTVGRIMTIKKGSEMKNISLDKIKEAFLENNFILENN